MIAIHDWGTEKHDYLQVVYLRTLLIYLQDQGVDVKLIRELGQAKDCTVLTDTEFLFPEQVSMLKNNGCKIVGFNMVDSSYIAAQCREDPQDIDLIFSLTGIQTSNTGRKMVIDKEFNVTLQDKEFLPPRNWDKFNMMRLTGRLLSLPYVHWERTQPTFEVRPYDTRSQKVLIRGGAHFKRVILAFFLMKHGLLDINSGFPMRDYVRLQMDERFRFCDECCTEFHVEQKFPFNARRTSGCTSPAQWGDDLNLSNTGLWNNRCPRSFYWLSMRFEGRHGFISGIETLMNGTWMSREDHLNLLGRVTFSADLKWLHSIYVAQRFWDSAMTGNINLLPKRTEDQEYFPDMVPDYHYLTFREDMSNLEDLEISKGEYDFVSDNALSLYSTWIKPSDYLVNTNLLKHIADRIL